MAAQGLTPYGLTRDEFEFLSTSIPTVRSAIPIRELRRQFQYRDRKNGRSLGRLYTGVLRC